MFSLRYVLCALLFVVGPMAGANAQEENPIDDLLDGAFGRPAGPPHTVVPFPGPKFPNTTPREDGALLCGLNESIKPAPQQLQLELPVYDNREDLAYYVEVDEQVFDFSQLLGKWIISQLERSMRGFENHAQIADIFEQRAIWKITASTQLIANVENTIVMKSTRFPEGAYSQYTHLYNRDTDTVLEFKHIFADHNDAGLFLLDEFVREVALSRANETGNENWSVEDLQADVRRRLPDDVFALNVDLVQEGQQNHFTGLKIESQAQPAFNYLGDAYTVYVRSVDFSDMLKPECRPLFSE